MPAFVVRILLVLAVAAGLPAAAQNVANGRTLYDNICRGCHGFPPLGGPERAANNPTLIAQALARVPQMQPFNGSLTGADIQDIAAYLGSLSGPPAPAVPAADYTDLWWNEAESGWGLNLIQHASNVVFGVMYTYDTTGKPSWFVLPGGTWSSSTTYSGTLYRVTGPSAAGATFDPTLVKAAPVGTGTLTFSDANHGTWSFTVDGQAITKSITRQPF